MKIIESNGKIIKIFSSAKEMPIRRYNDFQRFIIEEVNLETLCLSLKRTKAFIQEAKYDESEIEVTNSLDILSDLFKGVSLASRCFAVLIYEIDGELISDITDEGLNRTLKILEEIGLTQFDIENAIEEVKKKIPKEIESICPDFSDITSNSLYVTKLKRLLLIKCSIYIQEEQTEEDLQILKTESNWFLIKDKPKSYKELSLETERNFLMLLSYLELSEDVSVILFYSKLDYLNKKNNRDERGTI